MSIKKSKTSKKIKNKYDINFRPIPTSGSNNVVSTVLRGSKEAPKKLMPTTKLVGYTKEGAPIYEAVKTQNHAAINYASSRTRKHRSSLPSRLVMG